MKAYPQVFIDKRYVGDWDKIEAMIEADSARDASNERLKERSGLDASPWAGQSKPRAKLPKGVGFASTFARFLGVEAKAEDATLSYR